MGRPLLVLLGIGLIGAVAARDSFHRIGKRDPSGPTPTRTKPSTPARRAFETGLDRLAATLDELGATMNGSPRRRREAFRAARRAYKESECLLAMFGPTLAIALNGPTPEAEEDRPNTALGVPADFQAVEAVLFAPNANEKRDSIETRVARMARAVAEFRPLTGQVEIADAAVLDAMRLEWARIATVGLAGFDSDVSGDAVVEAAAAIEGMATLARTAATSVPSSIVQWNDIAATADRAARYLRARPGVDELDRLDFIIEVANPAAREIAAARAQLPKPRRLNRLWRQSAATLFDAGAFDPAAFAPDYAPPPTDSILALGRRLFHDPMLSGPGTRSCAFCHDPSRAFADGRIVSPLLTTGTPGARNTPTLLNAGLQPALFMDSRVGSLEAQVGAVLASAAEMGSSDERAAARVREDAGYRRAFRDAFRGRADTAVTRQSLRIAVAAYVRSLVALDSRFDRALRGDSTALTRAERHGFTVFMGKGRCATCHFIPLTNGTMPPDFTSSEPEIIGVPERDPAHPGRRLDSDAGRARVDDESAHRAAFKVPTLRNVAETAPYMHNGAFATLEEVVDFYDRGGGSGLGLPVPGQTLPSRRLHLSRTEKADLVAFLRTLSDPRPNR